MENLTSDITVEEEEKEYEFYLVQLILKKNYKLNSCYNI